MAVRVLIVDDHAPFRALARMLLVADGFDVVGEAGDGAAALATARDLRPDVVLLDVQLRVVDGLGVDGLGVDGSGVDGSGTDGFGVAEALAGQPPAPVVVLVSSRSRTDYGHRVDDSVAHGFIAKAELSGAALRLVLDGRRAS